MALDYKGPIGGKHGLYYHVVLDKYSSYPEIVIVSYTKLESLQPRLRVIWARFGYPEVLIHDEGPPYNIWEWQKYVKQIGCKMDKLTPQHPKSNAMFECMMGNLVKITHATITEGKEPEANLQYFLRECCSTPNRATGRTPLERCA